MTVSTARKRSRFYTPADISKHNSAEDCWVSIFGKVLDVTPLLKEHEGDLVVPIVRNSGRDISSWFDEETGEVRTRFDEKSGLHLPYVPHGRFMHVPPPVPDSTWRMDEKDPWWKDPKYVIGRRTKKVVRIEVMNTLTEESSVLEVCIEDTLEDVLQRYIEYNSHAHSYVWKRLEGDKLIVLDMDKTLEENCVVESQIIKDLDELPIVEEEVGLPVILLYFEDDLKAK